MYCTDDSFMVRAGFFLWWLLRLDQKDIHSQTDRQAGRQARLSMEDKTDTRHGLNGWLWHEWLWGLTG